MHTCKKKKTTTHQWLSEAKSGHSRVLQVAVSVAQMKLVIGTFLVSSITNRYNFALTLQLSDKLLLQDSILSKSKIK